MKDSPSPISIARELAPKNIHLANFVIDRTIRSAVRQDPLDNPDSTLDPDAIVQRLQRRFAQTYLSILRQIRSAWTYEVELRPWVENF